MENVINRNMTYNVKNSPKRGSGKNTQRQNFTSSVRSNVVEVKEEADRKMTTILGCSLLAAVFAIFYFRAKSAALQHHESHHSSNSQFEQEEPVFYVSMQTFFLAIGIVTLVIAVQRVMNKRDRDFKPSAQIEQITEEEFKY